MTFNKLLCRAELQIDRSLGEASISIHGSTPKREVNNVDAVLARIAHLALVPCSIAGGIADGLIGIGAGCLVVLSAGTQPDLNKYAFTHLYAMQKILTGPFRYLLKTIDYSPKFTFDGGSTAL